MTVDSPLNQETYHLDDNAFANIRPTKILFYLRFMDQKGFPASAVLNGTNLKPDTLRDQHAVVSIPDYIRVVSNLLHLSSSSTLAFEFGKALLPSDLGILGHAFSACKNASQGNAVWQRYSRLFMGNLISYQAFSDKNFEWYEFIPRVKLLPHLLQFFMEEKINIENALFYRFNNYRVKNSYFSFTYSAPPHAKLYEDLLQTRVVFNAKKNIFSLNIHDPYFSQPFPAADEETLRVCTDFLEEITNVMNTSTTLTARLKLAIREHLPHILTVEKMAKHFKLSTRTFCRNLSQEQTSYHKVLAQVREELILNYLATTPFTANEMAGLLGFSDVGSLRRGVKSWTGKTIGELRQQSQM